MPLAKPAPTGIEKIIADFWATGMDEARVNVEGLTPLRDRLAAIDALADGPSVADYLRKVAAAGENSLFAFFPLPDFKDSSMNIAYAMQGGLGLPDKTYYFDKDKKPIREAYEKHIAKVLELSGVPADEAGDAGEDRARVRDAPGQRVKVFGRPVARRLAVLQPDDAGRGGQADAEFLLDRVLRRTGHPGTRRSSRWPSRRSTRKSAGCSPMCRSSSGRATCAITSSTTPRRT